MRPVAFLFLFLSLYLACGFYFAFNLARKELKAYYAENHNQPKQFQKITFSVSEFNRVIVDENEFIIDGQMYDIVSRSIDNDSITVICYADRKEAEIFLNLAQHFPFQREESMPASKNLFRMLEHFLENEKLCLNHAPPHYFRIPMNCPARVILPPIMEIPVPPPRSLHAA
jgi:hypothetical protein